MHCNFNCITVYIEKTQHGTYSDIWKMNRFYDQFDIHKWIDFSGADYLSNNDEFSMIFFGAIRSPKVTKW